MAKGMQSRKRQPLDVHHDEEHTAATPAIIYKQKYTYMLSLSIESKISIIVNSICHLSSVNPPTTCISIFLYRNCFTE